MTRENALVHASSLTIRDPNLVTTLCLFYDKVYLPCPYDLDPACTSLVRWPLKRMDDLEMLQRGYTAWCERWKPLFECGALEVLPPTAPDASSKDLQAMILDELGIEAPFFSSEDVFSGRMALAMHALFASSPSPEIVREHNWNDSTDRQSFMLADTFLKIRVPQILEMPAAKIASLRQKLETNRSAWVDHVTRHVDELEERIQKCHGNEQEAATQMVKRKMELDHNDYSREHLLKCWAEMVDGLKYVLDGVKTAVTIAAVPSNPENYWSGGKQVLEGFKHLLTWRQRRTSTRHRAFQFISTIEKA